MSVHSAGWKSRYARGNRVSLKNEAGNEKVNVTVVHQQRIVTKVSWVRRECGKVRWQGGRQVYFQTLKWLIINYPLVLKSKCVISKSYRTAKIIIFFTNRFPKHSALLPLVGQSDSPALNSHHWLSQYCCCQAGWDTQTKQCFESTKETLCWHLDFLCI